MSVWIPIILHYTIFSVLPLTEPLSERYNLKVSEVINIHTYRGSFRFLGPEAYTIFGALFMKKNTKLGTKVNIY